MPNWLNYMLTGVASGAATGFASCVGQGSNVSWAHCGIMAAVGALVGVVNLFRQTPQTIH